MTGHDLTRLMGELATLSERLVMKLGALFLSPGSPYSIGALAIVFGIAIAATMAARRNRRNVPLRVLLRAVFPKRLLKSPSGRADVAWSVFNAMLATTFFGWAIFSSTVVEAHLRAVLIGGFGAREPSALPLSLCMAGMTVAAYVAYEFAYWLDHFLKHKIPLLWAFHKVHHSADSLSPLTNFRVHPIDSIIFFNIVAVLVGTAEASINFVLGRTIPLFAVSGTNLLVLATEIALTHLQHSHFWISFTGPLGRLVLSPAHHQIHHSTDRRHFDRNFGSTLAIWDRLFGTLHMPSKRREKLSFGLDGLGYDPHTAKGGLLMPLMDAWAEIRPRSKTIDVATAPAAD